MALKVNHQAGVVVIRCEEVIENRGLDEFSSVTQSAMSAPDFSELLIDLASVDQVSSYFLRAIAPVIKSLKAHGKKLYLLNVTQQTYDYIVEGGFSHAIEVVSSVQEVTSSDRNKPAKIDVSFLNPFINGTLKTLEVQCSIKATAKAPRLKIKDEPAVQFDIAAVIGITSPGFTGSIAICFPEKIFLVLMGNMLGETYTEITKDLEDGVAELLNIIFGQAKKELNENGHSIEKAIPTIIRGNGLSVKHLTPRPTILLPFETDKGNFHIEIATEVSESKMSLAS
jgi:chemotaxis protein CheX